MWYYESRNSGNAVVVPYLWGIETLYFSCNDGHLFICCTLPMRNWDIIVVIICISSYSFIKSCTLPMRNWNNFLFVDVLIFIVILVVPYLWGIETSFCVIKHVFHLYVLSYLYAVGTIQLFLNFIGSVIQEEADKISTVRCLF